MVKVLLVFISDTVVCKAVELLKLRKIYIKYFLTVYRRGKDIEMCHSQSIPENNIAMSLGIACENKDQRPGC